MNLVGILLNCLFITEVFTLTMTGTFNGASINGIINRAHTMTNSYCTVTLTLTPSVPAQIILMRTSPLAMATAHYGDYQHTSLYSNDFDMEHAIKGMPQMVQVTGGPGTIININLLVFQAYATFTYTLTIAEYNSPQTFCTNPPGQSNPVLSQYCLGCSGLGSNGPFCQTRDIYMTNSTQIIQSMASGDYKSFTISGSTSTIKLSFVADQANANIFIQFKQFSSQLAGLMNFADNSARFMTNTAGQSYQIDITSGGNDVSIGIINQNAALQMNFIIWYTVTQTVNVLVIVLGVLGGLLFIALVIAAFFIIKRLRSTEGMVNPRLRVSMSLNQQINQDFLNPQQIEVYFPSINCQATFYSLESSSINLNSKQNKNNIDKDCVICLCPVEDTDTMKITYCRHIFHSHCLVEWFKKQRNCPYCREQYSKSSTIHHYQQLLKASGKNMLAGVELAQEIMKNKPHKSDVVIQDLKD